MYSLLLRSLARTSSIYRETRMQVHDQRPFTAENKHSACLIGELKTPRTGYCYVPVVENSYHESSYFKMWLDFLVELSYHSFLQESVFPKTFGLKCAKHYMHFAASAFVVCLAVVVTTVGAWRTLATIKGVNWHYFCTGYTAENIYKLSNQLILLLSSVSNESRLIVRWNVYCRSNKS
jgi:hypothetical protein